MIRIIVAFDRKRGIAKGGVQPWSIPEDEAYFMQHTTSHGGIVLMGQKTLEAIGQPLPNRRNIVLSREMHEAEGVVYTQDLDKFLLNHMEDIWVIGGASVFEQTINLADELYITKIDADFGCDQFFPEFEHSFDRKSVSELHTQNGFIFTYETYTKL